MILRGDRNLTLPHVRKLAAHFKVSPELFILVGSVQRNGAKG